MVFGKEGGSMAKGSITRLEQAPKKRCRKWKLRYRKDGHDRTRRFSGTYSQAQAALDEFVAEVDSEAASARIGRDVRRVRRGVGRAEGGGAADRAEHGGDVQKMPRQDKGLDMG